MANNNQKRKGSGKSTEKYDSKPSEQSVENKRQTSQRRRGKSGRNSQTASAGTRENAVHTNDPRWYDGNATLVAEASRIPFNYQFGRTIDMSTHMETAGYNINKLFTNLPGVMAIDIMPTPGIATDSSSAVNIAASAIFQHVRRNLSTYASYAPADVMMYILGIDSIYTVYSFIVRLFGIAGAYSADNLYLPRDVWSAAFSADTENSLTGGAAFTDFINNLANYKAQFNALVYKASTLYMPTDFAITQRHVWLFSNYFMDRNNLKSQIYMFRPQGAYMLDETTSTQGTMLKWVDMGDTHGMFKVSAWLQQFDNMIEQYRNSDSMLKIAADLRRAYNDEVGFKLAYVPDNFVITPVYDDYVMEQIHNMRALPRDWYESMLSADPNLHLATDPLNITQSVDKNIVIFNPVRTFSTTDGVLSTTQKDDLIPYTHLFTDPVIDLKGEVTQDRLMEATRLMPTCKLSWDKEGEEARVLELRITSCGADIPVGITVTQRYTSKYDPERTPEVFLRPQSQAMYVGTITRDELKILRMITQIDNCPLWYLVPDYDLTTSMAHTDLLGLWGELHHYTTVDVGVLERLNDNIILSMWKIKEGISQI